MTFDVYPPELGSGTAKHGIRRVVIRRFRLSVYRCGQVEKKALGYEMGYSRILE